MLNSPILEVAISLVFVYLLFSLLASAAKEMIAGVLNLRGRFLIKGIRQLLSGLTMKHTIPFPSQIIPPLRSYGDALQAAASAPLAKSAADLFFEHATIARLFGKYLLKRTPRPPSYIADRDFCNVLLNTLFDNPNIGTQLITDLKAFAAAIPHDTTRLSLLDFLCQVDRGLPTLRQNVEQWYNDSMDRVSGWYKRNAQFVLVLISLLLALFLNVDTIRMTARIYHDGPLRTAIVTATAVPIARDTANPQNDFQLLNARIDKLALPIGWNSSFSKLWDKVSLSSSAFWIKLLGLGLTVLALSLGAPFWFDLLNKFTNLRAAGPKPEKSKGTS